MNIYITGHKSPDLDSMAAAYEYAEFLVKSKRYGDAKIIVARTDKPNKETKFVFEKFGAELPKFLGDVEITPEDKFILVDHNEEDQRHEKVKTEQILEIIDHHKIRVNFATPTRIDVKPYGSTSTLVWEHFEIAGIKPSPQTAGLIVSAILSDTQGLKASTTTGYDSEVAHKLANEYKINVDSLIFEIFKAKSDLSGMSAKEIVTKDYKIFEFGDKKVLISQIETVEPEKVLESKAEYLKAIEEVKAQEGVYQMYFVITDIVKVNSQILFVTAEEGTVVEKAFTTKTENNWADIGPRTSRKKDIAPMIEKALA